MTNIEDEYLEDILGGSSTSDDEHYLRFYEPELPEEALTNQEYNDQRIDGLKRKMVEQRMEFRASRKRMKKMHEDEVQNLKNKIKKLKERVECPVCLQVPRSGPVSVCPNGHVVCKDCRRYSCPTCRTPVGEGKSLLALTVIENFDHDCQFEECKQCLPLWEVEQHEQVCPERTVTCPDVDCRVKLPLSGLVSHLSRSDFCCYDVFPTVLAAGHDWVRKNLIDLALGWAMSSYSFDGQTFTVIPSKSDGQYYFALVMFGTRAECGKYKVEMVAHQLGTEATASAVSFSFCGNPASIDDGKDEHAFFGISGKSMKRLLSADDEQYIDQFHMSFKITKK